MKHSLVITLLVAVVALVACSDDPTREVPPTPKGTSFGNLTERWHVLNNIELAYSKRRLDKLDELLDDNFTFYLAASDVSGNIPTQWDRSIEVTANSNLFNSDPPGDLPRCKDIDMNIKWEDDDGKPAVAWVELTMPNDETWYVTTVFYEFAIDIEPDMTFINNVGSKASFTVRNAGTDEAPRWRLVAMRDLGGSSSVSATAAATEPATIGRIKVMYLP